MDLPSLGHAVIVNNVLGEMPGSMEDVQALKETYETIGYKVQVHNDLSSQVNKTIFSEHSVSKSRTCCPTGNKSICMMLWRKNNKLWKLGYEPCHADHSEPIDRPEKSWAHSMIFGSNICRIRI